MKKTIGILVMIMALSVFAGCQSKNRHPIAEDNFVEVMEYLTYEIEDNTKERGEDLLKSLSAVTNSHRIDYHLFKDESLAETFYENNTGLIEEGMSKKGKVDSDTKGNFSYYEFENDDYYVYIAKIDNSVLYVAEHPVLKETIEPIITHLRYGKEVK